MSSTNLCLTDFWQLVHQLTIWWVGTDLRLEGYEIVIPLPGILWTTREEAAGVYFKGKSFINREHDKRNK
jgi:hypothetical protein